MKKTLLTLITTSVLMLSGCASKSATPSTTTGLEGTKINTYLVGEYIDVATAVFSLRNK